MSQYLNTVIDRPITDIRHFTSVLKGNSDVSHHWTPIQSKAYRSPVDNLWNIPGRKGAVPMAAYDDNIVWDTRGNFQVPIYPTSGGGGTGQFHAVIPNPGNVISVLMNCHLTIQAAEAWGLEWADMFFWYSPYRTASERTVNNGVHHNFGTPGPLNQWNFEAVVIDLDAGELAVSTNNGAFTVQPISGGPAPKADPTINVRMGGGTSGQHFQAGKISDLTIVAGDVRDAPELMAAYNEYNQTGYANG